MIPSVNFNKISQNAGTVTPSPNVAAMIAPCAGGPVNTPAPQTSPANMQSAFIEGPLVEWSAYFMLVAGLPVLPVRPTTSTAASYGTIEVTKTGTFTPVAGSATAIADDYPGVVVKFNNTGALGATGLTYQYSLDDGVLWSPVTALGTALTLSLAVPVTGADTGIRVTLGTAAETVIEGDSFTFSVTGPRMTTGDLATSLEALRVTKQPWGKLLIVHGETSPAIVSQMDTWLAGLEQVGQFKTVLLNTRLKEQAVGSTTVQETEAAYATAMGTLMNPAASIRACVGADGAQMVSPVSSVTKTQPTSLYCLARAMQYSSGVDISETALGPLPNANIDDVNDNPLQHDEAIYPGLDGLRLTALRSFTDRQGVYVNNPNIISANGSDYTFLQYALTMNDACTAVFSTLVGLLSQGIRVDPTTGFILELQRAKWNGLCQTAANNATAGQVSGVLVTLSKTDPMTGNSGKTVTVTMQMLGLKYVKTFTVNTEFVNTLPTSTAN